MTLRRLAAPALLGVFALAQLPALSQNPAAPDHDPRIAAIIHSLEQVKAIRETEISPDGNQIAWNVSGEGIELVPLSDPSHPRHITACAAGTKGTEDGLAWSPDSKTLAFFSDCTENDKAGDHKTSIFLADASGSAAPRKLAPINGFAKSLQYTPDGKCLTFLYVEGATRPSGALAAMKPPSGVIGVEGLEVQRIATVSIPPNWDGTLDLGNSADVRPSSGPQKLIPLFNFITPANLHVYEFNWSPDSNKLTYVAAPPPGENNWWVAKLYTQIPQSQPQVIFDPNTTPGPLHGLQIAVPCWSPDGRQIAFIGGLMSDQGSTGGDIYVIPSAGGDAKNVTPDRPETATWISWTIPREISYSAIQDGTSQFRTINLDDAGTAKGNDIDFRFPANLGDGSLQGSLSIARGQFAFIKSSFSEPPEVWYARDVAAECTDNGSNGCYEFKQVTHYNDTLKPAWGKSESVTWENEGFHVQGWLLYPASYDPAKKYPMIVMVHGGPSSAVVPRWPSAGFGGAPFSALGYFVLEPNPRGSYGEGEKFTAANRKDFGYGDLRDILAGVDTVTKKYSVDPERVGITGWSYGGFMTMFAVSQTHRFRAAVAGAGIANWQSYYGENSIDQWMTPFFGASVYDDPAVYAKSSAINFIKNVKTPTLVVVGDRDGECPAPQSFEFWHALRDENVPTQLVVYPNEGHGFADPAHRIDVLERALAWFNEYMK
jgi:dipeptidyl aminopeptidase/acylaminoacyl peptidase